MRYVDDESTGDHFVHPSPADVEEALARLADAARADPIGPGPGPGAASYADRGVTVAAGWYLRWLSQQVLALGAATVELAGVLTDRAGRLEAAATTLAADAAELASRLERIEGA